MTIFDIVQRALIVHQFLLTTAGIGLTFAAAACALLLFRATVWTFYRCFIDAIEIYSRIQAARLDIELRRLPGGPPQMTAAELWQDYTRLRAEYRRLQLLTEIDRESNTGLRVT